MNVSEAIRLKRAVREFQPQPLEPGHLNAILNAGRRAQSSKNTQPWHFIAIQERETLLALSKLGPWAGHLAGATARRGHCAPRSGRTVSNHVRCRPGGRLYAVGSLGTGNRILPGQHLRTR